MSADLTDPAFDFASQAALDAAFAYLSFHPLTNSWLQQAAEQEYQFRIAPDLNSIALHDELAREMLFRPGGSSVDYAASMIHELVHFLVKQNGRIYGSELTPIGDMQQRLCEEAVVVAICADINYCLSHGIGTENKAAFPELWQSHLEGSGITAGAYEKTRAAGQSRNEAIQAAFQAFFTIKCNNYLESYQNYSIGALCYNNDENTRADPDNFNENFSAAKFLSYVPQEYQAALKPVMQNFNVPLVLSYENARGIEGFFVKSRLQWGGADAVSWSAQVQDLFGDDEFTWHPAQQSLKGAMIESVRAAAKKPNKVLSNNAAPGLSLAA